MSNEKFLNYIHEEIELKNVDLEIDIDIEKELDRNNNIFLRYNVFVNNINGTTCNLIGTRISLTELLHEIFYEYTRTDILNKFKELN